MGEFTLPANIKQIGSIGDGLRIYIEDYVYTYLQQFAEAGGYDERIAFLVGRHMVIDGQSILFISGAIQGKGAEEQDGLLRFTEQSHAYADNMRAKYFDGAEIVGWMQSQPSYGLYLNQRYATYHRNHFTRENQVMFVMDPMERLNTFYLQSNDRNAMTEIRGYFIYYDKNAGMHEFMLNEKYTETTETFIPAEEPEPEPVMFWKKSEEREDPAEIIRNHQETRHKRRSALKQRRGMNLLAGLSAVLFIICFVMGAGLIRNQDRITVMEDQLVQLSTAYRNLFVQVSERTVSPVFAERDNPPANDPPPEIPVTIEQGEDTPPPPGHEPEPEPITFVPPAAEPVPEPVARTIPETYTIQPGDSLIAISVRFYGNENAVAEIMELNGIENADRIQAGRTLALP
jgi:LysM repeat protein